MEQVGNDGYIHTLLIMIFLHKTAHNTTVMRENQMQTVKRIVRIFPGFSRLINKHRGT
jgi:hypothetical protein